MDGYTRKIFRHRLVTLTLTVLVLFAFALLN